MPRKAIPPPLEKEIQKQIGDWIKLHGGLVVRVNSGAMTVAGKTGKNRFVRMNSEPGCSDLLVCWQGLFVAIECKRDKKQEPTDNQKLFLDKVRAAGGCAIVATSVDDVARMLKP